MFALRTDQGAKKPDARKPARADHTVGQKAAPETNPCWQALALHPVAIQPKLAIGQPDDPYEHEADHIADRVVRMATPSGINDKLSFFSDALLQAQRKCAGCEEDEDKKLQRKAQGVNAESPETALPLVHQTLNSSGQPLDRDTLSFMEERFGYDFKAVRVHDNADAAASADAIHATAYTVGSAIAFGSGSFNPATQKGRRLLAHELTHVVQQAEGVKTVQRDDKPGADKPKAEEKSQPVSKAGAALTKEEREALVKKFGAPSTSTVAPAKGELRFVLHDTAAGEPGKSRKEDLVRLGHTALGEGYLATIPATNPSVISSKTFFEAHRVTVTQDEQADSVLSEAKREPLLRQVWAAADEKARNDALTVALSKKPDFLTKATEKQFEAEVAKYRTKTIGELTGTGKIFTGGYWAVEELCRKAKVDGITSVIADFSLAPAKPAGGAAKPAKPADTPPAAITAVPLGIVSAITAGIETGTAVVAGMAAVAERRKKFTDACTALEKLFATRNAAVQSSAHVEMVQPEDPGTGCTPGKGAKKLSNPYTTHQYQEVEDLYLKAALEGGRFPFITTHYFVQQALGDRCDPRCFDLGNLYQMLQKDLGHKPNTIYGLPTNYGEKFKGESIWWHPVVCGGLKKTTI